MCWRMKQTPAAALAVILALGCGSSGPPSVDAGSSELGAALDRALGRLLNRASGPRESGARA